MSKPLSRLEANRMRKAMNKRRQRQKEKDLGILRKELALAYWQWQQVAEQLNARGYQCKAEYLFDLVRRDAIALARDKAELAKKSCDFCNQALPDGCKGMFKRQSDCAFVGYVDFSDE